MQPKSDAHVAGICKRHPITETPFDVHPWKGPGSYFVTAYKSFQTLQKTRKSHLNSPIIEAVGSSRHYDISPSTFLDWFKMMYQRDIFHLNSCINVKRPSRLLQIKSLTAITRNSLHPEQFAFAPRTEKIDRSMTIARARKYWNRHITIFEDTMHHIHGVREYVLRTRM